MASAYRQFRGRCLQKMITGLAIVLAGIALALSDVELGGLTIPGSIWLGAVISLGGLLYGVSAVLALRARRKSAVLS